MVAVRVHIEEWHFGDEGWVFNINSRLRLPCDLLDADDLAWLLRIWDRDSFLGVQYTVADGSAETGQLLEGTVTAIWALACRFPSSTGGTPVEHSGTAYRVRQARGQTGDMDFLNGVIQGFVIDLDQGA